MDLNFSCNGVGVNLSPLGCGSLEEEGLTEELGLGAWVSIGMASGSSIGGGGNTRSEGRGERMACTRRTRDRLRRHAENDRYSRLWDLFRVTSRMLMTVTVKVVALACVQKEYLCSANMAPIWMLLSDSKFPESR